jgi:hypothetical protein
MKMNLKKLMQETDNGILDEIIGKAETKMAEPFKKKEAVIAIAKPEEEMGMEGMDKSGDSMEGENGQHEMDEANAPAIPQEDMEMLMELYSKIKGSKGE